jgi:hypothetical protein
MGRADSVKPEFGHFSHGQTDTWTPARGALAGTIRRGFLRVWDGQMTLDEIRALVAADMTAVDGVIRTRLASSVPLVSQVAEHIVAGGGKRLRPLIVLLSAHAAAGAR